jgi:hypothetical protein
MVIARSPPLNRLIVPSGVRRPFPYRAPDEASVVGHLTFEGWASAELADDSGHRLATGDRHVDAGVNYGQGGESVTVLRASTSASNCRRVSRSTK